MRKSAIIFSALLLLSLFIGATESMASPSASSTESTTSTIITTVTVPCNSSKPPPPVTTMTTITSTVPIQATTVATITTTVKGIDTNTINNWLVVAVVLLTLIGFFAGIIMTGGYRGLENRLIRGRENLLYCSSCGQQVYPSDKFCPRCRNTIETDFYQERIANESHISCSSCGAPVNPSSKFCDRCGNKIETTRKSPGRNN